LPYLPDEAVHRHRARRSAGASDLNGQATGIESRTAATAAAASTDRQNHVDARSTNHEGPVGGEQLAAGRQLGEQSG
jgi:hypothetical protein